MHTLTKVSQTYQSNRSICDGQLTFFVKKQSANMEKFDAAKRHLN